MIIILYDNLIILYDNLLKSRTILVYGYVNLTFIRLKSRAESIVPKWDPNHVPLFSIILTKVNKKKIIQPILLQI